jgi:16S rRNA (guanine527-N7)-methyltransferase
MNEIPPEIRVRSICQKNGLLLSDEQYEKLTTFVDGLLDWNRKINLISRKDTEHVWFSHILHSLTPLFYLHVPAGWRLFDLGTGGGLPGIPLAIARPDLRFTLADSIRKKMTAVEDLASRARLDNVDFRVGRGEEIAREKGMAGRYDLIIARAVAPLAELMKWTRPLSSRRAAGQKKRGDTGSRIPAPALVALKGGDLEREIAEARARSRGSAITVINMSFEGSLELGLQDKKLVLAQF